MIYDILPTLINCFPVVCLDLKCCVPYQNVAHSYFQDVILECERTETFDIILNIFFKLLSDLLF